MVGGQARRLAVRVDDAVWREAVRGFSGRALEIATSGRARAERRGLALAEVLACDAQGPDRTELSGCAKLYLPPGEGPPSERPFAFVLQLARAADGELVSITSLFLTSWTKSPRRWLE